MSHQRFLRKLKAHGIGVGIIDWIEQWPTDRRACCSRWGGGDIDRNIVFSLKKNNRTRGHEVTLVKDQCRLDIRKYSISQRTINEYNKLSTGCVTASSVNMFKNKVDTYLRRADYN